MGIDDFLLVLVLAGVVLGAVAAYYLWPRPAGGGVPGYVSERGDENPGEPPTAAGSQSLPRPTPAPGAASAFRMHPAEDRGRAGDLVLLSATGEALLGLGRMGALANDATPLDDPTGVAQAHACQLAMDLIARSVAVTGATIELVYQANIRQRLAEPGVELVKVRQGDGRRAMQGAVDSRKFRGYGVAIEPGRLAQIGKELEQLGQVVLAASPARWVRLAIVFDHVERAGKVYPRS